MIEINQINEETLTVENVGESTVVTVIETPDCERPIIILDPVYGRTQEGSAGGGDTGGGGTAVVYVPHIDAAWNLSWTNNGGLVNPDTVNIKGLDGTSAYQAAVAGGYVGTEAGFNSMLADILTKTQADLLYESKITYPATPTGKFYRDDKTFSDVAIGVGSSYPALYLSNNASDVAGFKKISYVADASETIINAVTVGGTSPSQSYLFDALPTDLVIDAGTWNIDYWRSVSSAANNTTLTMSVFKRSAAGVITELFKVTSPSIEDVAMAERNVNYTEPSFTIDTNHRIGVAIYAKTTMPVSVTASYVIGNGRAFMIKAPVPMAHAQLKLLNGDSNFQHINSTEKANVQKIVSTGGGTKVLYDDGTYKTPSSGGAAEDLLIGEYTWAAGQETVIITTDKLGSALSTRNLHAIDIIFNGLASAATGIKACLLRINEITTNYVQDTSVTEPYFIWYSNQVFSVKMGVDMSDGNVHYSLFNRTSTTANGSPVTNIKYGYRLAVGATINHIRLSIPYVDGFPTAAFKVTIRKRG